MVLNSKKILILLVVITLALPLFANNYSFSPLKSLLLPGWGQLATSNNAGYYHIGLEVAIISSLVYFNNEANVKKNQSINYAIQYANINHTHKGDDYLRMIGRYSSSYYEPGGYNQQVLSQAITAYPGDPIRQQEYIDNNAISDDYSWSWSSDNNRFKYNDLRKEYYYNQDYVTIFTGVIIANHIFSFVDMLVRYKSQNSNDNFTLYSTVNNDLTPMLNLNIKF